MNVVHPTKHRRALRLKLLAAISIAAALSSMASGVEYLAEEQTASAASASTATPYLLYRPGAPGDHAKSPVVVALYGAGGSMNASNFASEEFSEIRRELSQAGYVTIVPELGPSHWMNDDAIARVDDVLNMLSRDDSLDAQRVHFLGSSMGGGSALAYAVRRPARVASVISHMGMTDFAAWIAENPGYSSTLAKAYGAAYPQDAQAYDSRSAIRNAKRLADVRVLLIHGMDDENVLPNQSIALYRAMIGRGGDCSLRLVRNAGHTNGSIASLGKKIVAFLANELPEQPVMVDSSGHACVETTTTPGGIQYKVLRRDDAEPAPALIVLSGDANESLGNPYFLQCGLELQARDYACISLDLPSHGNEREGNEPEGLVGWSDRVDAGKPFVQEFTEKVSQVLDDLVAKHIVDVDRIAICGTSRGGFLACHAAAADPRIKAVVCMAPVTSLNTLSEFKNIDHPELADRISLASIAPKLAGRPIWIAIGDQDERVGVDDAIEFSRCLTAESLKQGVPSQAELHVVPEPRGHTTPPRAPAQAADWIEEILRQPTD
ncbi:alpha/beta hydrolase family protein [Lacipirellula parvula]|uniref:Peptidase S9 prolyl oligopeptidase catalytic domain-containing protein n=1 Tax=Lacipirellula parvula TaxID=2650471 RepID=A0A5K7XA89_9BACT|nr:alpha/beta fold hydrolase [Lacipirellula parvula]BBO33624.1 hypothetical protein PLANPX_3236 [Lacipirellula parvula]